MTSSNGGQTRRMLNGRAADDPTSFTKMEWSASQPQKRCRVGCLLLCRTSTGGMNACQDFEVGRDCGVDWRSFLASARRLRDPSRSEEHTSELQSLRHLVCRL